jgi:thioredoxin-related protein
MKKIIGFMIIIMLILSGCGEEKDDRSIKDLNDVFLKNDIRIDFNEKPYYDMIGAKDGVIFYMDNSKVAIYQYESKKDLENAKKEYDYIKEWESNGKFLIETSNPEALKIFSDF